MISKLFQAVVFAGLSALFFGMAINFDPNTSRFITKKTITDYHTEYLQKNQPQLAIIYDTINFQINQCNKNLDYVNGLKRVLKEESSLQLLQSKQTQIIQQKEKLTSLFSKLNKEIERGMIFKEFNSIDQGGTRQEVESTS
jgi:hypothetical protein